MARIGESADLLKCSFCGKSQKQVQQLIAGPGVYICDECVELCNEIIEERLAEAGETEIGRVRAAQAERDLRLSRGVRHRPRGREEGACSRGLQPLQAGPRSHNPHDRRPRARRRRDREVEHPAHRPHGLRQDLPGANACKAVERAVRRRRRDRAHRGRLRRRRRREHPAEAHSGGRLRREARRDGHHLHRRGRQDRPQGREPVDHERRLRRGRTAGAAEDPRGHSRVGPAAGRPQAPASGVHPDRHDERAVHRGRCVRRTRGHHLVACGQAGHRLRRPPAQQGRRGRHLQRGAARRPAQVRAHSRIHRPAARRRHCHCHSTATRSWRS